MIDPQNFPIDAGADVVVTMDINPDVDGQTLVGSTFTFRAYEQEQGNIIPDVDPVLEKNGEAGGITVQDPALQLVDIAFTKDETAALLRNYYYEITLTDAEGNVTPRVAWGFMTVNGTEYRASST